MRDLLVVLNPRKIDECLSAIRQLPIDKLWLRNMSELDIEDRWDEVLAAGAKYDRWFMSSDDGIPRLHALEAVRALQDWPVVTGYSNFSREDMRVNLTSAPLRGEDTIVEGDSLRTLDSVMSSQAEAMQTWLVGFTLTGMAREMWEHFPFQAYGRPHHATGFGSDFSLSKRLQEAGVPCMAARDAFVYHVKEVWNQHDADPRKRLLIGVEPPDVVLEVK